jgi:hypothetical protein
VVWDYAPALHVPRKADRDGVERCRKQIEAEIAAAQARAEARVGITESGCPD